jgi:hypothetical protein
MDFLQTASPIRVPEYGAVSSRQEIAVPRIGEALETDGRRPAIAKAVRQATFAGKLLSPVAQFLSQGICAVHLSYRHFLICFQAWTSS